MPTSLETITKRNRDDVYAALTIDTEDGSLRAQVSGPEGGMVIEIEAARFDDCAPAMLDEIDRRLKAWDDAIDALRLHIMTGALDYLEAPED